VNNPLSFTDESGEFIHIIVGAVIGGLINLTIKAIQGDINSLGDGLVAFGIGALAGGVGAATGGAAFFAAGGVAAGAGGFAAGFVGGAVGSAFASPIQNIGNHIYFGDPLMTAKQWAGSILIGGVTGGVTNGTISAIKGNNFWNGNTVAQGRGVFSFNNTPKAVSTTNTTTGTYNVNENIKGVNYGQQAKHIPNEYRIEGVDYKGTQYLEGRSVLQVDPEQILDDIHSLNYNVISESSRGYVIELNYNVGTAIHQSTNEILGLTNMVMIRSTQQGFIHFIPYKPY
jgi:hypothetical protein